MTDTVLAQLTALKDAPAPALKAKWRELFDTEPPPYNRRFLESRLAYRIQELAYGGLKKETVERLRVLGKQYDGKPGARPKGRSDRLPIAGHPTDPGMAGHRALRHRARRRFRVSGTSLQIALGDRPRDYPGPLEWLGLLWSEEPPGCGMTREASPSDRAAAADESSVARSIPASRPRKGSRWSSTPSTPSGRPARPMLPASGPRAGSWSPTATTMAGFSGGTLERPALKRLLADIEAGKVDVVVVYKIDRLSRSLMDFSRLVEVFDRQHVTFVSVTQSFNTTTSMGRLTLNVLLSFAQFEREVIGERIRDKFAASRKQGMWMGGWAPLGYEVRDRKLVVNEDDAKLVRSIFQRFLKTGSATILARQLIQEDVRNKYGKLIDKGILYKLLNNPVYIGEAVHKGVSYPGEHVAIVDRKVWDKVQAQFQKNPRKRAGTARAQTPSLLKGMIFGPVVSPCRLRTPARMAGSTAITSARRP